MQAWYMMLVAKTRLLRLPLDDKKAHRRSRSKFDCVVEDLHVDVSNTKVILEPWTYWYFVVRSCVSHLAFFMFFHAYCVSGHEAVLAKGTFREKMQHLRLDR